jgi:hypothetical protein
MKLCWSTPKGREAGLHAREQAQARVIVLALVCLAVGFACAALWLYRGATPAEPEKKEAPALCEGSQMVLKRLDSTVEARFYSVLDPAATSEGLRAFADRVDQVLAQLERESGGKIKVIRLQSSEHDGAAALADGLKPFNFDKGDTCYLGVAFTMGTRKEVVPRLMPEWERAVEPDLTRAIERLLETRSPERVAPVAPVNTQAIEEVKRVLPNFASVSLEEGTRMLRTAALGQFADASDEMANQLKAARQRLDQAQSGGTEAEKQAAIKNLQEVQAAQMVRIQNLAAHSQAQIDALRQLKQLAK